MSITRLPDAATRQLCATLVLVSPSSAVKELLDNALDAGATAVEVLISANTLGKIQVRDNGHGIAPEDINAACVSQVIITTRTAQDKVASSFILGSSSADSAVPKTVSAPVGTTVELNNLYSDFPVRRKVFFKEAPKSIASIKTLLQAYALARPETKLTFKVLGDEKSAWSYAPRERPNPREAALQIFGVSLANQYVERTISTELLDSTASTTVPPNKGENNESGLDSITIRALVPKPDADHANIAGKGAYVSVDSRPMGRDRGIFKKLVKIINNFFQTASNCTTKDLFLYVDIKCAAGIYDLNISPAKDEVAFMSEQTVLDLINNLCLDLYTPHEDSRDNKSPNQTECSRYSPMLVLSQKNTRERLGASYNNLRTPESSLLADEYEMDLEDHERLQQAVDSTLPNASGTLPKGCSGAAVVIDDGKSLDSNFVELNMNSRASVPVVSGTDPAFEDENPAREQNSRTISNNHRACQIPLRYTQVNTARTRTLSGEGKHSMLTLSSWDDEDSQTQGSTANFPNIGLRTPWTIAKAAATCFPAERAVCDVHDNEGRLSQAMSGTRNGTRVEAPAIHNLATDKGYVSPLLQQDLGVGRIDPVSNRCHSPYSLIQSANGSKTDVAAEARRMEVPQSLRRRARNSVMMEADPRRYLVKRQRSMALSGRKTPRRLQSDRLPLETTTENAASLQLQAKALNLEALAQDITDLEPVDSYLTQGDIEFGLPRTQAEKAYIEHRLREVVADWLQCAYGTEMQLELNL
ncbi:Eukaryotic translation initiation factor eIF-1 [Verticillium dahliae VDG1]|nr:Eukaryotic translation initiation factor eIF-1 [Verticillium dahliae VDG1]